MEALGLIHGPAFPPVCRDPSWIISGTEILSRFRANYSGLGFDRSRVPAAKHCPFSRDPEGTTCGFGSEFQPRLKRNHPRRAVATETDTEKASWSGCRGRESAESGLGSGVSGDARNHN